MNSYLTPFRIFVILFPQLTLGYFIAGSHNLLGGFNQSDAGFTLLMAALALTPLLCLGWLIIEARYAYLHVRSMKLVVLISGPLLALLILIESLYIDAYILSHFRM